jgi:O-antigen ligase
VTVDARSTGAAPEAGDTTHGDRALLGLLAATFAALLLIPERYTVPLVGGLGLRPYQLLIVALGVVLFRSFRHGRPVSVGPSALLAGLLVVVALASAIDNFDRLDDEAYLGAMRLIVTLTLYVVLAVVVAAVATTPARRRFVLGVMVTLVAVAAIFAIRESVTEEPFRLQPTPPGLVEQRTADEPDGAIPTTVIRNDVARPAGLAANPLELSAVMSLAVPFAVLLVFSSRRWLARIWFLGCSLLIGLGVVLSISRTGVLSAAVVLFVALLANLRRPRIVLAGLVAVAVLGFTVARLVPHSVQSLTEQLSKDGDSDPSLATRLQDYQELDDLLGPHPWLGRGPQAITTYVSRDGTSMILDNQYLLSIAETGVIGLAAMVVVILTTAAAAERRIRDDRGEQGLFTAVLGATLAFAVMAATFDVLRFSQASAIFMVIVGLTATRSRPARAPVLTPAVAA